MLRWGMVARARPEVVSADDGGGGQRGVLHGVSWELYGALRDAADAANRHVSMTYLDGTLELARFVRQRGPDHTAIVRSYVKALRRARAR